MTQTRKTVSVRILDKDYQVACNPDEEALLSISARHLDNSMRSIRSSGKVVGSGDIVEGAAKGAVLGVVGGAIMGNAGGGAGAGAAIGGIMGGARRHRQTNEMVTTTHTNPEYEQFVASKDAFKQAFQGCLAQRAAAGAQQ